MPIKETTVNFLRMIRFSHTVFALPFALLAVVLIYTGTGIEFSWFKLVLIIAAFTGMRSFSMAFNRLADAVIDEKNPRTAGREIPAGVLSRPAVIIFAFISLTVVLGSAWLLAPIAFYLSFPAAVLLAGYSYSKRFTWLCHLWLGASIGMAVPAVYVALVQKVPPESIILWLILMTYIAGFDILYSMQDRDFDVTYNLKSVPVSFGIQGALVFSSVLHIITVTLIFILPLLIDLGIIYYTGAGIISLIIFLEHKVVGWGEKVRYERIPVVFFNYNAAVSILFFVTVLADRLFSVYNKGA